MIPAVRDGNVTQEFEESQCERGARASTLSLFSFPSGRIAPITAGLIPRKLRSARDPDEGLRVAGIDEDEFEDTDRISDISHEDPHEVGSENCSSYR